MNIVKMVDVCDFINGGAWSDKEYVTTGLPVLKVSNCKSKGFQLEDINYLPYSSKKKYAKNKLILGDVIIATVGSHPNLVESAAGRSCIVNSFVDGYYLNQNAVCLRTKDYDILDQAYLGYLCKERNFQNYIQNKGRGAANQMRIAIGGIKEYEFELPDIRIQKKVADILSSYDNLIENNQKQIKLLEEAARRLYKEWFVDLHFPGYEDVPVVDGVPEGWERKTVLECLEMYIGGGWGKESIVGKNTIPGRVIRGTDINDIKAGNYRNIPLRFHTENDKKKRSLQTYDIVFELSNGNINNIGRSLLIDNLVLKNCGDNTICASFCKLFRPLDKFHSLVLYSEIQDMQISGRMLPYKKQGSNGINNFAFEDFLTHELLIPNDKAFIIPIENIMAKMSNIQNQFALLNQARDRLLPKLMSGELEV